MSVKSKIRAAAEALDMYEPLPAAVFVRLSRPVSAKTLDRAVRAAGCDHWDRDRATDIVVRVWL